MKILKSLVIVFAMVAMVAGATSSYFTDQETIAGVTFSTGTLSITNVSEDWMQPVDLGLLKPGDLVRKWVRIQNDGTLPIGTLTVAADGVVDTSGLLHHVNGWTYGNIMGLNDKQTGYNTDAAVLLGGSPLLTDGDLLQPGQWTNIQVQFVVPTDLDNSFQGQTVTFNLVFHAEQVH